MSRARNLQNFKKFFRENMLFGFKILTLSLSSASMFYIGYEVKYNPEEFREKLLNYNGESTSLFKTIPQDERKDFIKNSLQAKEDKEKDQIKKKTERSQWIIELENIIDSFASFYRKN